MSHVVAGCLLYVPVSHGHPACARVCSNTLVFGSGEEIQRRSVAKPLCLLSKFAPNNLPKSISTVAKSDPKPRLTNTTSQELIYQACDKSARGITVTSKQRQCCKCKCDTISNMSYETSVPAPTQRPRSLGRTSQTIISRSRIAAFCRFLCKRLRDICKLFYSPCKARCITF